MSRKIAKGGKTLGDKFDGRRGVYFPALDASLGCKMMWRMATSARGQSKTWYCLIPLNQALQQDINVPGSAAKMHKSFSRVLALPNVAVFLDSGVFSFFTAIARQEGKKAIEVMSSNTASFGKQESALMDNYVDVVRKYHSKLWGTVEIDIGTMPEREERRRMMEMEYGIVPIPVFRVGVDTVQDLESLCARYDRVCIAGMYGINKQDKVSILAMLLKKFRKTYFHILGLSARSFYGLPELVGSCDATTYITVSKFGYVTLSTPEGLVSSDCHSWLTKKGNTNDRVQMVLGDHFYLQEELLGKASTECFDTEQLQEAQTRKRR